MNQNLIFISIAALAIYIVLKRSRLDPGNNPLKKDSIIPNKTKTYDN